MSLIPTVKCRRCGTSFSSLRSSCPHCGTKRVSQSTRSPGTTSGTRPGTAAYERTANNMKWQMIFGLILVVAVILAVIVMVSTGVDTGGTTARTTPTPASVTDVQPTVESAPTPTPTPTPTVERIQIRYYEAERTEFTMKVGESLPLNALVYPLTIDAATAGIKWSVGDTSILKLTVDNEDPTKVTVECLQNVAGGTKIYVECCGIKVECQVYTSNP